MTARTIKRNTLFYGDNLDILRTYIPDESIDLIYLDPPFNSNRSYNVLFRDESGSESEAQIVAFEDTWHWGPTAARTYEEIVTGAPDRVATTISALRQIVGTNQVMAYLVMMTARLVELHRVLKPTGSLYLHCDPIASHYLKVIMDSVFGAGCFVNEIIWQRTNAKGLAFTRFATNHDVILRYAKSDKWTWNPQYTPHDPEYVKKFYRFVEPETGREYGLADLTNPNRDRPNLTYEFLGVTRVWRWTQERMQDAYEKGLIVQTRPGGVPRLKRYLDEQEGNPVGDIWTDILPVQAQARERLDYPTQKPVALLERIIAASSNPGDIVLDPFCGCGTAIAAAQRLGRQWVGIDITHLSISLQKYRLKNAFDLEPTRDYDVIGEPVSLPSARALAAEDRFQFQWWALSLVRAKPQGGQQGGRAGRKGADRGIDGVINFIDGDQRRAQRVIVQVKSGKVSSRDIRDLVGTLEREDGAIGVFITLEPPTRDMIAEAASAGFYRSELWKNPASGTSEFPRVQILTIEELLGGKLIEMPAQHLTMFKEAPSEKKEGGDQMPLM